MEFKGVEEMAYFELPRRPNVVSTRWVLSEKINADRSIVIKARLVALGYEDVDEGKVTPDAPTTSAVGQRLVLAAIAERQWIPETWDFKTALL